MYFWPQMYRIITRRHCDTSFDLFQCCPVISGRRDIVAYVTASLFVSNFTHSLQSLLFNINTRVSSRASFVVTNSVGYQLLLPIIMLWRRRKAGSQSNYHFINFINASADFVKEEYLMLVDLIMNYKLETKTVRCLNLQILTKCRLIKADILKDIPLPKYS